MQSTSAGRCWIECWIKLVIMVQCFHRGSRYCEKWRIFIHLTLENGGNTFLRNVGDHSPNVAASHPRRLESPKWQLSRSTILCSLPECCHSEVAAKCTAISIVIPALRICRDDPQYKHPDLQPSNQKYYP